MVLVGVGISFTLEFLLPAENMNRLMSILHSVVITVLVWEGNGWIDYLIDKKYNWLSNPVKRIAVQLPLSMIYSSGTIWLSMIFFNQFICSLPESTQQSMLSFSIVIGLLVTLVIISIEFSVQFFGRWKETLVEVEKHKKESLQAQLENLKNQLNPHFLFNNLSVLSSLVYKDQDKAVEFINQFAKVYRYSLDNKNRELVDLQTELDFVNAYCYLLKIRFDEGIQININVEDNTRQLLLPPMAVQLLLENTIKHNEASEEQPLYVHIKAEGVHLCVSNNLQLRTQVENSSKTGLINIQSRYRHFTDRAVEITNDDKNFSVCLPLLKQEMKA